jgi:hypothetical protein
MHDSPKEELIEEICLKPRRFPWLRARRVRPCNLNASLRQSGMLRYRLSNLKDRMGLTGV